MGRGSGGGARKPLCPSGSWGQSQNQKQEEEIVLQTLRSREKREIQERGPDEKGADREGAWGCGCHGRGSWVGLKVPVFQVPQWSRVLGFGCPLECGRVWTPGWWQRKVSTEQHTFTAQMAPERHSLPACRCPQENNGQVTCITKTVLVSIITWAVGNGGSATWSIQGDWSLWFGDRNTSYSVFLLPSWSSCFGSSATIPSFQVWVLNVYPEGPFFVGCQNVSALVFIVGVPGKGEGVYFFGSDTSRMKDRKWASWTHSKVLPLQLLLLQ